jgi:hypothetical protein
MKTKTLVLAATILAFLATCAGAKVFQPSNFQEIQELLHDLKNGDSFSVECRNNRTGTIDRETVDVDAATVTIEIPGSKPIAHHVVVGLSSSKTDRL